jgi:hypothetical protein
MRQRDCDPQHNVPSDELAFQARRSMEYSIKTVCVVGLGYIGLQQH